MDIVSSTGLGMRGWTLVYLRGQSSSPQSRSYERKLLNSDGIQGDLGVRVARDL